MYWWSLTFLNFNLLTTSHIIIWHLQITNIALCHTTQQQREGAAKQRGHSLFSNPHFFCLAISFFPPFVVWPHCITQWNGGRKSSATRWTLEGDTPSVCWPTSCTTLGAILFRKATGFLVLVLLIPECLVCLLTPPLPPPQSKWSYADSWWLIQQSQIFNGK